MSKTMRLVIKSGSLTAIYDDALVPLLAKASTVETKRASHVEPDGKGWSADMSPVNGPVLRGYNTRAAALEAEVRYLNERVL